MTMTRTFMTGRSQAVRIPKEFRLPDEEICVNRVGKTVTLTAKSDLWDSFVMGLQMFTDDFMKDGRPEEIPAERESL